MCSLNAAIMRVINVHAEIKQMIIIYINIKWVK